MTTPVQGWLKRLPVTAVLHLYDVPDVGVNHQMACSYGHLLRNDTLDHGLTCSDCCWLIHVETGTPFRFTELSSTMDHVSGDYPLFTI